MGGAFSGLFSWCESSAKLSKKEVEELKKSDQIKFHQDELEEWYTIFHENYPNGKMSRDQFIHENVQAHGGDSSLWAYLFEQLDVDRDGCIDFKEFIESISIGTRGGSDEKLCWTFKFYDKDKNSYIEYQEMLVLFKAIFKLVEAVDVQNQLPVDHNAPAKRCQNIFEKMDTDNDGRLSIQEFIDGCKKDPTIMEVMELRR
eukprot:TRINITY_DN87596_c0_g1_i1.p1 TRINITY_DN87596_c0_g1~~TRINITY_DN87596_c0_g1_i1.p1  ORF type:complete len:201 (-),score=25.29 TRINITY_DN87596_c0_g1_i1:129-731(-)